MNSDNLSIPVVVIGAGPAGLSAAAELAHHGIPTQVIDPRTVVSHARPRAKTTSPRTMEHFRRWGVSQKLRDRAPLSPAWNQRVVFCETLDGPTITDFFGVFGLSAGPHDLFAESGQQVPQPLVEDVLREHVAATGLVDLRLGETVTGLVEDGDGVTVTIENADGGERTLVASYVLACDGARSIAREAIGATLERASAPMPNLDLQMVNVVFRSQTLKPVMGDALHYWVLGAEVPGNIGPLNLRGLWWAGFAGFGDWFSPEMAEGLVAGLAGREVGELDIEVLATDPWTPRTLLSTRFATDRIFLVGESAHLNPPFGGHGFNTCVGDAVNIGWKLAAVLSGWGGPHLLASYEAERRHVAESTIESAAANLHRSGPAIARTAERLQETKNEEFHSLGLVLGYSYAGSPVIASGDRLPMDVETYVPSTSPGARLPHAWIEDGHSLFDDLGRGMTLLHPRATSPDPVERFVARATALGIPVTVLEAPTGEVWPIDTFLLVRPDQHIAWSGSRLEDVDLAVLTGRHQAERSTPLPTR